ncbi:MAG: hypothetical protein HZB38_11135 [Planctomycetes bacterium]|nr:hypothetical protein [Planctomycetota bacterium]
MNVPTLISNVVARGRRFCAAVVLASSAICAAQTPAPAPNPSLAESVPADIGLFVEIRDAEDLLIPLLDPQLWSTLAELAGQPSQAEDVEAWRALVRQTVKMEPDQAIRTLFARRVAFLGEGPSRAQDAVVVCRPTEAPKTLLERWKAQRLTDAEFENPPTYQLHGAFGVAERDDLLYFGTFFPADGLFRRVLPRIARPTGAHLADDPTFKQLRGRVAADVDGLLFARLSRGESIAAGAVVPVSQPAQTQPARRPALFDLPGPLRAAKNVLVGVKREGTRLHLVAVGDSPDPTVASKLGPTPALLTKLPEQTLLAWQGQVNYIDAVAAILAMPEGNRVRAVISQPNQGETARALARALDSNTCVAVGMVNPAGRPHDAPPVPALAALLPVRDEKAVREELATISEALTVIYNAASMLRGLPPLGPAQEVAIGPATAAVLDFSRLLDRVDGGAIREVQLAWTIHDGVLMVATHVDWLKAIVAARTGQAKDWHEIMSISRRRLPETFVSALAVQSALAADLGRLWLSYLEKHAPAVVTEAWWRQNQPSRRPVQLGIDARILAEQVGRLSVTSVSSGMPADGRLEVGDQIIGASGRRFATTQPHMELRAAVEQRPHGRYIDLSVLRSGAIHTERVPLPFTNLVQTLRRAIAIGKLTQRALYFEEIPTSGSADGVLTIELRTDQAPLIQIPPPASQPTSAEKQIPDAAPAAPAASRPG